MSIEILIVDDNADIRNILNELIVDAGYKTRLAANYKQALNEDEKFLDNLLSKMAINKARLLTTNIKAKGCNFFKTKGGNKVTAFIKAILVYLLVIPFLGVIIFLVKLTKYIFNKKKY